MVAGSGPKGWSKRSSDRPVTIDWSARWRDVLRLARGQLYDEVVRSGWRSDDLDQELICRVLARQQHPRSRYDPARAAVSTYLRRLTSSLLRHILEEQRTLKRRPAESLDAIDRPGFDVAVASMGVMDEHEAGPPESGGHAGVGW